MYSYLRLKICVVWGEFLVLNTYQSNSLYQIWAWLYLFIRNLKPGVYIIFFLIMIFFGICVCVLWNYKGHLKSKNWYQIIVVYNFWFYEIFKINKTWLKMLYIYNSWIWGNTLKLTKNMLVYQNTITDLKRVYHRVTTPFTTLAECLSSLWSWLF